MCRGQNLQDVFVGTSVELVSQPLYHLILTPGVGYQADKHVQVGFNLSWSKTENTQVDWAEAYIKYYYIQIDDNTKSFIQVGLGQSFQENWNRAIIKIGITGFLNDWVYVEPALGYSFTNFGYPINKFGINFVCGVKL